MEAYSEYTNFDYVYTGMKSTSYVKEQKQDSFLFAGRTNGKVDFEKNSARNYKFSSWILLLHSYFKILFIDLICDNYRNCYVIKEVIIVKIKCYGAHDKKQSI